MKKILALLMLAAAAPGHAEGGRMKACNEGTFSLTYRLVRAGPRVVVRNLAVRVRNNARYYEAPTPRLRDHEAMHQRINVASAKRLERELSNWSVYAQDLKSAEALLKRDFKDKLKTVDALNREWDRNSVFMEPAQAPAAVSD
jgi:hypothetical protein